MLMASACSPGALTARGAGVDAGALEQADASPPNPRIEFEEVVEPILTDFCGSCHSDMVPAFLEADPDVYTTVTEWPNLLDLDAPAQSRLLTKGAHAGPALTNEQMPSILGWLQAEQEFRGDSGNTPPETRPFTPVVGINTVALDEIGLEGATVSFRMEKLQVGLYISELTANAGATGMRLTHPLFVSWVGTDAQPDPVDRFADIDIAVAPAASLMIGGGTAVMVDIATDAQLSLHFDVAEPSDGDGGGTLGGGCKAVTQFAAIAQPLLSANCVSCHGGGNAGATGAVDMTSVNDLSDAGQGAACAQILSRVNLADPPNSGVFLAPDPGSGTGHSFKFPAVADFIAYRDGMLPWITAEQ